MEVIKDDYIAIFTSFYKKMIKHHSRRRVLIEKFQEFLNIEGNKDKLDGNSRSQRKILQKQATQANSARLIDQSNRSRTSVSPVNTPKLQKSDKYFESETILYSSKIFLRVIAFAYLHNIIESDNLNQFQQISEKIANYLDKSNLFDEISLKRVNYLWMRIGQFLTKRSKIRWVFQMKQSFNQFTDDFIKVLLLCNLKINLEINKVTQQYISNPQFLKELVKKMGVNIALFNVKQGEIEKIEKYGTYKKDLPIGYQVDEAKYIYFQNIPTVKSSMNFTVDNLNKKISKTIQSLLKDYKQDTEKLLSLQFLTQINTEQDRIKKHLSII